MTRDRRPTRQPVPLWALAALAFVATPASEARAHDAPSGWTYPYSCCSGYDCYPIAATDVRSTAEGWLIQETGEVRRYTETRNSPDGLFHRCSVGGDRKAKTLCLFVPPVGM